MRIAHCLLETAHGPLSYEDLVAGGRGVTGSEQTMLYLARAQAAAGHRVVCYLPTDTPGVYHGVELADVKSAWPRLRKLDGMDVVISWLTADFLRGVSASALRVLSIQINDWMLSTCGFDKFVDVYVSVSDAHKEHLLKEPGSPGLDSNVVIIPNGVELSRFSNVRARIPRRCVYLSSPDRGLHWILAMWPEIRLAYPDVELHVFYEVQKWIDNAIILNSEIGQRARYLVKKANELKGRGVVIRGAVSPAELAQELLQSDVMLYPCDPVRFTEGFGNAILEVCAAGVVPVITDADALGEVYASSGAFIAPRTGDRKWTDKYLELVLSVLGDQDKREEARKKVRTFAQGFGWERIVSLWDETIKKNMQKKLQ